jgi:hypothetical protein
MKAKTIVLFGEKGSGKDTVGAILSLLYGFKKESFAGPMKEMVKLAFPSFTDEHLYGSTRLRETEYPEYPLNPNMIKEGGPKSVTPRLALQTLGTEWGQGLYPALWADGLFKRIDKATKEQNDLYSPTPPYMFWVVTDGRFDIERLSAAKNGAHTVLLLRGRGTGTDEHRSESELRNLDDSLFDYRLNNTGPLEDLGGLVVTMLKDLIKEWDAPWNS